ncbi:hypothetical protein HYH02_013186 [Chlamydomonas schloesseri]|uniref:Nudix hydrolase domain-containing protein n=1 Tax=Chlamydomonas schloesseri TaxID=2026947 RepID=A0A835T3U8_9CHLO|nr:hypothetical protein HYH02_013186 [Chlamydomonas schloesseri]|eukprot:KAG2431970.1 hypothetical protein HYH02_013186 [Chlamydomonas schloesseri]
MCVIVDEENRVVGAQPRDVTVRNRLLGRGAYVLVFSPPAPAPGPAPPPAGNRPGAAAGGQQQQQQPPPQQQQQLLVYKRSSRKDVYPGHWDVVTAGVVRAGEEYEDTAARELAEELGVSEAAAREGLSRLFVFPYKDNICHVWGAAFTFTLPAGQQLALQEEEVDWAGFKSMDEVSELLKTEQFTPVGKHILHLYHQQRQQK